jgi:GTPase
MLGEERLLTSDVPGTTRDSIDTKLRHEGRDYLFIDTAGLRKKARISARVEEFSVVAAIRAIDRADVAVLVIDAEAGITSQDKKIAHVAAGRGCACVVLVNKWDLIEKDESTAGEFVKEFRHQLPFLDWAPVLFVSAKTGTAGPQGVCADRRRLRAVHRGASRRRSSTGSSKGSSRSTPRRFIEITA